MEGSLKYIAPCCKHMYISNIPVQRLVKKSLTEPNFVNNFA